MARSALGLTRLLAYQAIDVETIDGAGLRHLGTVAPLEQVSDDGLAQVAVERNDRLLHCATGGVLNTTEFFAVANRVERT